MQFSQCLCYTLKLFFQWIDDIETSVSYCSPYFMAFWLGIKIFNTYAYINIVLKFINFVLETKSANAIILVIFIYIQFFANMTEFIVTNKIYDI